MQGPPAYNCLLLQHLKAQYLERFTKIKWAIVSQLLEVTNQGKPELEVTRKTLSTMRGTAEGVLTILEVPDLKTAELLRRSHFPLGLAHLQQSMDQFLNAEGARLDTLNNAHRTVSPHCLRENTHVADTACQRAFMYAKHIFYKSFIRSFGLFLLFAEDRFSFGGRSSPDPIIWIV